MGLPDLYVMMNGLKQNDFFSERNLATTFEFDDPQHHRSSIRLPPNVSIDHLRILNPDSSEDSEIFSDIDLSFISRMLMEEDIDEKLDMYHGNAALEAAEKPFHDILSDNKYLSSPDQHPTSTYENHSTESPPDYGNSNDGSSSSGIVGDSTWVYEPIELPSPIDYSVSVGYSNQSSFSSINSSSTAASEVLVDPSYYAKPEVPDQFAESLPAWQFMRGVEEARRFLPSVIDLEANGYFFPQEPTEVKAEEAIEYGSRGRKNPHTDDLYIEDGRSSKQSASSYTEETLRSEMFDLVLLPNEHTCKQDVHALRQAMQSEASKSSTGGSGGGKGRGRKQSKGEMVDLRTLLIHCAQSVSTDDRRSAYELLKQIRQHSSPKGDGMQRLAHCFADGLEARLAGTGSQKYRTLMSKKVTAADILKAYKLYMAACPFKKLTHFFSNQTILNVTEKASRVHIIDFGIYYGFQWPCFLQCLSNRKGGPPKLRITGIEFPEPGFRPTERIDETGRRIAEYARDFGVPFEYNAIAAKWETIRVDDLKIDKDEMLIVNCLFRFENVADETVAVDCPRDAVLKTIRKLNPTLFIQAVVNGSYSAPFFVTRFREALFQFSSIFDMLEANVPHENEQRLVIEQEIFGRQALNVIACEGSERVERPETYKKWQVRNLRAGFVQLPLNPDMMKKGREKSKGCHHHKDFIMDEDGRWLLMGWKGRILYAVSTWRPNNDR